jgi:small-conductance mechanosensitive channel
MVPEMDAMSVLVAWWQIHWAEVFLPVAVFLALLIVTLWLRQRGWRLLERANRNARWAGLLILSGALRRQSVFWCLLASILAGLAFSQLDPEWKDALLKVTGSLWLISLFYAVLVVSVGLADLYGGRAGLPRRALSAIRNTLRVIVLLLALLVVLELWGMPTTPVLLVILVLVLVGIFFLRDAMPNLAAGFQLSASQQVRTGDYIKLESGEEGQVTSIGWRSTQLRALDGRTVIVPNRRLLGQTLVNYGRPLKKARTPFLFNSLTHLTSLTGLKATSLRELADILRASPEPVVYYHTHRFLAQHQQLTPEPSNDFAVWVQDAIGDDVLAERLESVDTFSFPNLGALRDRLVSLIEERLAEGISDHSSQPGREFHFMKAVSFILPTSYAAHDLREFVEALRTISTGTLYFHVYEARLRLGRGRNDFSAWLEDSLGEPSLAEEVARLDPYNYTLEGLRSALIQLIEKRIK